jgi:hypothetical protein
MRRFWFLILMSGLSLSLLSAAQQPQPQPPNDQPSAQQPGTPPPSAQPPSQSSGQPGAQQPAQPPAQPNDQPNAQQPQQPSAQPGSQPTDTSNQQSAQTMRGKIARAGNQLIFQEGPSQTPFQLDDQSKAAPFEGKSVKVRATIDPKTSILHVVDIGPSEK